MTREAVLTQALEHLSAIERATLALLEAAQQQRFSELDRLLDERQQLLETFFRWAQGHGLNVQEGPLAAVWARVAELNLRTSGAVIASMALLRKSLRRLGGRRKARAAYPAAGQDVPPPSGLNVRS